MSNYFFPLSVRRRVRDAIATTVPDGRTDLDWLRAEAAIEVIQHYLVNVPEYSPFDSTK